MQDVALLKILQQFCLGIVTLKPDQRSPSKSNAGFTFIELLIVIMMVGILSAIAAPSWISFVNQRRVNAVNDAVLRALQEAQQEAKKKKLSYSISFNTHPTKQDPRIVLYVDSPEVVNKMNQNPDDNWKPLGAGLELKSGQIWMGTNLSGKNTTVTPVSVPPSAISITPTTPTITFDYTGVLPRNASTPLKVVVAAPPSGNSTQPLDSTKRCVIVQTLLGTMRTAKGTDCN